MKEIFRTYKWSSMPNSTIFIILIVYVDLLSNKTTEIDCHAIDTNVFRT